MTKNEEWQRLIEEMKLTPPMLTRLTGVNRSTLHGYQSGKSAPTQLSMAFLKLLKFIHDRDPALFMEFVTLSEFDQVEEGAKDPRIAAIYQKGKLPKDLSGYLDYLNDNFIIPRNK